ncbi:hypothetical protein N7532_010013 [Penicillium argentinense]|uniref:Uncharacterized protein n=1 Tax=Penicillium argentinense TaxID=1131581 RepID=A0A9W9ENS4_9EURO|nr:uncharacterized protein N7532_010013 [Penicillium argentinense]KAJ5085242.1 hypothetical protein N7532_010013 [Penicillium argentinense]
MLFVSALLFRFLEEMTEPADKECRSHVMSAELLLRILDDNLCSSLLTDAALIVVLRQDIFIANLTQRPVGPLANRCNIDRSLTPTSDVMWAYRIMSHAAEITNFVYSEESDRSTPTWDKLMAYAKDWENCRPNSFTPLFQSQTAPPTFPNPVFASDCHVAGHQYLGLCRILLLACDPHIPMLGMNGMRMLQERDEKTRDYVRDICGTAMANSECFPAVSTAGLVIGMCGEMFSDPEETGVLLELIAGAEGHLRWHHLKSKESLQRFWGLSGS